MKFKITSLLAALAIFLPFEPAVSGATAKPILAHYMPWFVTPYSGGGWGYHWTLNHYNPNLTNSNGQAQIGSWYYPMIGPYDSLDPAVLEYHVLLMKLGGIDGVIVDWYGNDNSVYDYGTNNLRTSALFTNTQRAGLLFSLCYEDATIKSEINGGFLAATNAVPHCQQTMLYAQSNFFTNATYCRLGGQPLLLNFGPQFFTTNAQWVSNFSVLNASNQPAFFTEDNRYPVGQGAFDWPPMSLSGGGTNQLTTNQLNNYLNNFESNGKSWPAYVSSAFPRFHDIYVQAGAGSSLGILDDANGQIFQQTLRRAFTNNSSVIQLVTWNDFGEGTIIEPTVDYGYRDLGVIQDYRRQYVDASFPYHTNDLAIALQYYNLRKQYANNATISAEMARIFTNIVSGKLATASAELNGIASNKPVIYALTTSNNTFQFSIGGYLASGAQVLMSTNLAGGMWQTVKTFPASTNLPIFSTNFSQTRSFFKVQ